MGLHAALWPLGMIQLIRK